ncbi:MAG TPA: hypothetical protein VI932_01880 [Bacteroidota bacterium]|nr:hypothetical protein [Bacteroidota bacterium]
MIHDVLGKIRFLLIVCSITAGVLSLAGCSDNPLSPFQPEIGNNADNFQFQATAVQDVTTTAMYLWNNTGTRAKVNQSSAITDGAAEVVFRDADNVEVYRRSLSLNGDSTSAVGAPGNWTVVVTLTTLDGTLNFRAEKL